MKRFLTSITVLVFAAFVMAQNTWPQLPLDPAVRQGKLSNGLTYYIRHNEWPEHRADFYIAQKVGSMQEEENQRGLAHFLEHMCFNGTTHFPGDALKQYLERIGVKFGENLNAYTSFDETVYNVNNVNVQIEGAVDSCLLILHDWSHDLTLDGKEIDKERGVINEEWRMRRSAMMRMQENAFHALYEGSKYADRMPIGTMDIVMNFPYDDLRNYYRRWYRPDLQAIVIVGDVDVDVVEEKIKTVFSDIQTPAANAPQREYFPVQENKQPIVAIEKDKEQPVPVALLMFKYEAFPREVKQTMPYAIVPYLFNAFETMFNERIEELVQQANSPFVAGNASHGEYLIAKTMNAVTAQVVLKDNEYLSGIAAMYRELLRVKRFGFTQAEYDRFKQEYFSQLDAAYERRNKVQNTRYVQEYVRHFLDAEPAPGIEWEHEWIKKMTNDLPLKMINSDCFPNPGLGLAIALFLPDKEGVQYPSEEEILKTIADVEAEDIEGYTEEVNNDPLVPELSDAGRIVKRKADVYGATLLTLSNGMRVHVLPTDYTPNQISMQATSWGGTSLYPNDEYLQADNAAMISLGGWGTFSATTLQKRLAGIQASASPSIGDRSEGISGSCVKKDFETMLQLLYLCFTSPRRDDEVFKSTIERFQSYLANQELDPRTALQDTLASVLYNNNVRARRMKSADLAQIDYDRLLEIYGERFANAADFEFYVVGDLDVDSVAPLLARYLGALPTAKGREKYRKVDNVMVNGQHTCIFEKEQDTPNATINFVYHAPVKEKLKNEQLVSILGQAMQMLYTETVREDEGGAYGVPVRASLSDYPQQQAVVQIQLPTAPEKVERMTQVIYDGVEKMCNEGPSDEVMQKIREYMLRAHAENLKKNSYWMSSLYNKTRLGYEFVDKYEETLQKLTPADVQKLARRVFHSGNRVVVGMKSPQ
ncbi:MAG: insulinase family protein [Bacteroidaceae bacterium]|nr:insulinase family protein [Bacteroidaceae bacterium]